MNEDLDYDGPRLWDATPGVCCAAFQLGACPHTENGDEGWDDDYEPAEPLPCERAAGCTGDVVGVFDQALYCAAHRPTDAEWAALAAEKEEPF